MNSEYQNNLRIDALDSAHETDDCWYHVYMYSTLRLACVVPPPDYPLVIRV